ncbi:hypothetical protein XENTR_v10021250 [Xenopus tropicalis]|nr:hypothetical protein XENTR_v10021250 [Xenopus tropicalis]
MWTLQSCVSLLTWGFRLFLFVADFIYTFEILANFPSYLSDTNTVSESYSSALVNETAVQIQLSPGNK